MCSQILPQASCQQVFKIGELIIEQLIMLTLKSGLKAIPVNFKPGQSQKFGRKFVIGSIAASLVTATNWYFQNQWAKAKIQQEQTIIDRVVNDETATRNELNHVQNLDGLVGKKVKVAVELEPGRFVVKRNRGDQVGYLVLAPAIVYRNYLTSDTFIKTQNTKYMLNLGWVPKERKHKINEAAAIDVLEFDENPQAQYLERWLPSTSTISAYVRRGEQEDILRGYRNWKDEGLSKFIDLNLLQGMFGITNMSGKYVYLDRTEEEGAEESFPFPNTKENYIQQLRNNQAAIEKTGQTLTFGVGLASFASAVFVAAL